MRGLLTYLETYLSTTLIELSLLMLLLLLLMLLMSPLAMTTLNGPTQPPVSSPRCLLNGKPTSIRAPKYMNAVTVVMELLALEAFVALVVLRTLIEVQWM